MSVALAKKKSNEAAFDLNAVLAGAQAPKDAKSKSKVPVLMVAEEVKKLASKIRKVKDDLDSLDSQYEALSAELVEKVAPVRETLCKQGYVSSVRVPDDKGLSVGLSWSDKYSAIPSANEAILRELAGDRFDDFFAADMTVTVRDISEESLTELVKAIGPERFAMFFNVDRTFKPTSRFTQEQYTAFTPEQRQGFAQAGVKQYKPSIRVK